jgi:hypothetical protein
MRSKHRVDIFTSLVSPTSFSSTVVVMETYNLHFNSFFFQKKIEMFCLQDLMFHAIHAQRAGRNSMASRLNKVLLNNVYSILA